MLDDYCSLDAKLNAIKHIASQYASIGNSRLEHIIGKKIKVQGDITIDKNHSFLPYYDQCIVTMGLLHIFKSFDTFKSMANIEDLSYCKEFSCYPIYDIIIDLFHMFDDEIQMYLNCKQSNKINTFNLIISGIAIAISIVTLIIK